MGITIVQKSDLSKPKRDPKIALVLAGGAISGGAFKLGGLHALSCFLTNRRPSGMDIFLGLSAGAFLAAPLAAGIPTRELLYSIEGQSDRVEQLRPWDFYNPNVGEFLRRPLRFGADAVTLLPRLTAVTARFLRKNRRPMLKAAKNFVSEPNYSNMERVLAPVGEAWAREVGITGPWRYMPSGLFDNSRIEGFIRRNLESNGIPNNFRLLHLERGSSLYIGATHLDSARGVVFGHDEDSSVTISEAVQASTAIPGFFKPAKIGGQNYLDAGVRKTANISTAIRKGADLVIAYNPFRPFDSEFAKGVGHAYRDIAESGFVAVLNQTFRTLLHTRLHLGIEKLRLDESFRGDVILIEPTETDLDFFEMSPLAFWSRAEAAHRGFDSTRENLERNYPRLLKILQSYDIDCSLEGLRQGAAELDDFAPATARSVRRPKKSRVSWSVKAAPLRFRPRLRLVK